MENTDAIEVRKRDGKTYYVVVDPDAWHDGACKLLAEVQRIKSEGDYAAAKKLFEDHGIHFDPELRDEVVTLAMEIAGKVVREELTAEKHRKLVDGFLAEVEQAR